MHTSGTRGRRVALVIGNSSYRIAPLKNTARDAEAVARALARLGFASVKLFSDLRHAQFSSELADFGEQAEGADMAVIFYAGHGLDVDGETYLLPVDKEPSHVRRLKFETHELSGVLSAVAGAKTLGLVILDACRNSPFRARLDGIDGTRSTLQGLAAIEPHGNVLVAYSAKHGTVAQDGTQEAHSPFTRALLEFIDTPNLDVRILFGRIRDAVLQHTGGAQEPHLYGALGGREVYLADALDEATAPNVFISYAKRDRDRVGVLGRLLQARGWNVFWDEKLDAGAEWREEIEQRLRAAHCVVAVWSKNAIRSDWVKYEAGRGMEQGILVPVTIDGTPPPRVFEPVQAVNLKDWDGRAEDPRIARVVSGIEKVLARSPAGAAADKLPPELPPDWAETTGRHRPSQQTRYDFVRLIAIGGVAALLPSALVVAGLALFLPKQVEPRIVKEPVIVERQKTATVERPAPAPQPAPRPLAKVEPEPPKTAAPPPSVLAARPPAIAEPEPKIVPPAPVPALPPSKIETGGLPGGFLAVVSSAQSRQAANETAHEVREQASDHLRNKTVQVRETAISGKGTYYRVVIEPAAATRAEAQSICAGLKDVGFEDCFTVAFP